MIIFTNLLHKIIKYVKKYEFTFVKLLTGRYK